MGNYGFTVIDGDMKYIDPSGIVIDVAEADSDIMFVNFTLDDSSGEEVYSADKTFSEVAAAIDAGKMVTGKFFASETYQFYCHLSEYLEDSFVTFLAFTLGSDGIFERFKLSLNEDDTVTGSYVDCDLSTLIVED